MKIVRESLNEEVIDKNRVEIDIDYDVLTTNHSTERQTRNEEDPIGNEEIADNVRAGFDKITKDLIFDELTIGDRVIIKNTDSNLNIVGQPVKGQNNTIIFRLITVMRHPEFRNIGNTKVIEITDDDMRSNSTYF